jgi:flagellar P-ring protein FlgI
MVALLNTFSVIVLMMALVWNTAEANRIKDITSIAGVRSNPLIGYGLVVGLDGTGDGSEVLSKQSFMTMLNQLGLTLPAGVSPSGKNFAAVLVHTELPAFARPGQKIDVTVSSVGSAKSLLGGALLMAPLKGVDGVTYAVAQGSLVVNGFMFGGKDGSHITMNVPSVGRIPGGATVEKSVQTDFTEGDFLTLYLNKPDFTTARRVSEKINAFLGPHSAQALDSTSVKVVAPRDQSQRVAFVSAIENLELQVAAGKAKVIINSRTGTVVVGQHVTVSSAAISHGSLMVSIMETYDVSQPNPLAEGDTVVTPSTNIDVNKEKHPMLVWKESVTLEAIVQAVNQIGANPEDLVAILDALRQAGALQAEIEVI